MKSLTASLSTFSLLYCYLSSLYTYIRVILEFWYNEKKNKEVFVKHEQAQTAPKLERVWVL